MSNPFVKLLRLLPQYPLQVGTVSSMNGTLANIELPGGNFIRARGTAEIGQTVFVRNGLIEGEAPALSVVGIEV